jgi:hypothetical protein
VATHRHKRDTNARRTPRAAAIAAPIAVFATLASVGTGVLMSDPAQDLVGANRASFTELTRDDEPQTSRDLDRAALASAAAEEKARKATEKAIRKAHVRLWTTAPLNLWDSSDGDAKLLGEIAAGKRVLVTGRRDKGRAEIVLDNKARWVTQGYLSEEKPFGLGQPCTNGTSVPSGVSANIVKVHSAVCGAFPEISVYGTFRGDGEHAQGIAVDIMVSGERGWQVANFVREHYSELGVSYVIYAQHIWSVERSGEGWRPMSDRGSATANHYDHVHVTTF